jgi:hypothetical protein
MRVVEYYTIGISKHKWHLWLHKLACNRAYSLFSATIKLNGLWNQSKMWKETHLLTVYIHTYLAQLYFKDQSEHAKLIILYYLQMNKKSAGVYLSDEVANKKNRFDILHFQSMIKINNTRWKKIQIMSIIKFIRIVIL